MHINHSNLRRLAVCLLIFGVAPASAVAQHVHGVIELGVVVEGDTVAVSLSAPLSDVVGFEHEPKNDDQEDMIQQAASVLSDPESMFGLTGSVNCEVSNTTIDGPDYVLQHLTQVAEAPASHADHHHDHHDHDEHDGESAHEEHAEVVAAYEWKCGDAAALDALDLRFTERFANVETINVQILTAAGAQVLTVEGPVASISLSSP